jgi:hypothetical protein
MLRYTVTIQVTNKERAEYTGISGFHMSEGFLLMRKGGDTIGINLANVSDWKAVRVSP